MARDRRGYEGTKGLTMAKAKASKIAERDDYQAEDDVRTLQRAEEIKGDGDRMKRAAGKAKDQAANAKKIIELHKAGKISDKAKAKLEAKG